jgi:hypothetical protein
MLDRICKIGISDCKEDEKFRSAYEGMILVSRSTWVGDRTGAARDCSRPLHASKYATPRRE